MESPERNNGSTVCYCSGSIDELGTEAMQQCIQCHKYYHFHHLKSPTKPKLWLLSDHFWNFVCKNCNGIEKMERLSLSWVQLVQLILYNFIRHQTIKVTHPDHPYINSNLNSASKSNNVKGGHTYFRWKEDICRIIDLYWNELCPDRARSPTWNNTVASALSTNSKIFLSGTPIFDIGGWWSLHTVLPPGASNQTVKKAIVRSKKLTSSPRKQSASRSSKPTQIILQKASTNKNPFANQQGDGLSTDSDDISSLSSLSDLENMTVSPKIPSKRPSTSLKGRPSKVPQSSQLRVGYDSDTSSLTSLDHDDQKPERVGTKSHRREYSSSPSPLTGTPSPKPMDNMLNSDFSPPRRALDNAVAELFKSAERRNKNIDIRFNQSTDTTITLPLNLDIQNKLIGQNDIASTDDYSQAESIPKKVYKFCENDSDSETASNLLITQERLEDDGELSDTELEYMDPQTEWETMMKLSHTNYPLPAVASQMLRKLQIRRTHRNMNRKLFDLDNTLNDYLYNLPTEMSTCPSPSSQCTTEVLDNFKEEQEKELSAYQLAQKLKSYKIDATPYNNSFASRVYGNLTFLIPDEARQLKSSVYNLNQPLKPFLRREFHYRHIPPRMQLLHAIELYGKSLDDIKQLDPNDYTHQVPIDFCYFQRKHLDQVNQLLCRAFWPGINISDALDFPEFTVIALYKQLVIGCAFMTPEGYITYIAVSDGWQNAGIGKFMIYHLIQTGKGQDITLHVSANNPAMIMYQKFGFKPEQFLINFYDKYLPPGSTLCKNSLFIRLRQK